MDLNDLKKMLGLDTEADKAVDRFGKFGMLPPPPSKEAAFADGEGGIGWSPDIEGAKTMAEGSDNARALRSKQASGAGSGAQPAWALDEASANKAAENMLPPERRGVRGMMSDLHDGDLKTDRYNMGTTNTPDGEETRALIRSRSNPVDDEIWQLTHSKKDAPDGDAQANSPNPPKKSGPPAALLEAYAKAGVNPETTDAPDVPEGQQPSAAGDPMRRPAGMVGPMATARPNRAMPEENSFTSADYRAQVNDPNRKIFGDLSERLAKRGGGQDDQLAQLRAALERKNRLYAQAEGSHEAGVGADIAHGTHYNANQGEGLRKQADAEAEGVSKQIDTSEQMAKFASDQTTAEQNRRLRDSGETRAVSEEGRKQKSFETAQADSDPNSETSANARASVESLYPKAWSQIPEQVRSKFSAKDVMRIFGELSQEKGKGGGSGLSVRQELADERGLVDFEKNLVKPSTIDAYKRLMGRVNDQNTPLYGMGAGAKAVTGALGAIPYIGQGVSDFAGGALRGLTPDGQEAMADAIRILDQIKLDTTGQAMNESEMRNLKIRLGMSAGNDNAFRNAIRHEFDAARKEADRQLQARNPRIQKIAKERGITPDWEESGGGALPYALETEGRFDEADEARKRK